jgi:Ca2+-binding EF-hand superfamily protein
MAALFLTALPAAAALAQSRQQIAEAFSDQNFRIRDTNQDDKLTVEEFIFKAESTEVIAFRKKVFAAADLDKDGVVTRAEARRAARGEAPEGGSGPALSPADRKALSEAFAAVYFKQRDVNKDGKLTQAEFIGNAEGNDLIARRKRLYALADANKDGLVTQEEVTSVIAGTSGGQPGGDQPKAPASEAGEKPANDRKLTPAEREAIAEAFTAATFKQRDRNEDGKLTEAEFLDNARDADLRARRIRLFRLADMNNDKHVTRDEVTDLLAKQK